MAIPFPIEGPYGLSKWLAYSFTVSCVLGDGAMQLYCTVLLRCAFEGSGHATLDGVRAWCRCNACLFRGTLTRINRSPIGRQPCEISDVIYVLFSVEKHCTVHSFATVCGSVYHSRVAGLGGGM